MDIQDLLLPIMLLNIFIFLAFTTLASIMLFKFRLKVDKSSLTTIAVLIVNFGMTTYSWHKNYKTEGERVIPPTETQFWLESFFSLIPTFLFKSLIIFFVFEMRQVYLKVKIDSCENFKKALKKNVVIRNIIFITYLCLMPLFDALDNQVLISVFIIRELIDTIIAYLIMSQFIFFVNQRLDRFQRSGKSPCLKFKLIVLWVLFLITIQYLDTIMSKLIPILIWKVEFLQNFTFSAIYVFVFESLMNFFTAITILYLFYSQAIYGRKAQQQKIRYFSLIRTVDNMEIMNMMDKSNNFKLKYDSDEQSSKLRSDFLKSKAISNNQKSIKKSSCLYNDEIFHRDFISSSANQDGATMFEDSSSDEEDGYDNDFKNFLGYYIKKR
ncbi:UNKNOWN [Stylonychia lemnae]|uniref:Transmembrane protein n=1 Tax=Stylonychia lemnae TaxID=5949 RepID=A0A077ZZN3_STYLE|nr:UNKNOWN [Stylonychia lemnae]|eukprot:CDW75072.1 UNKNOWN [Stylonychia lemnae]